MVLICLFFDFVEEVILAEERTTDEERRHIIEGKTHSHVCGICLCYSFSVEYYNAGILWFIVARRRADIKRKKLKTLGKSKSTESEEECEEEEADEGKYNCSLYVAIAYCMDSGDYKTRVSIVICHWWLNVPCFYYIILHYSVYLKPIKTLSKYSMLCFSAW